MLNYWLKCIATKSKLWELFKRTENENLERSWVATRCPENCWGQREQNKGPKLTKVASQRNISPHFDIQRKTTYFSNAFASFVQILLSRYFYSNFFSKLRLQGTFWHQTRATHNWSRYLLYKDLILYTTYLPRHIAFNEYM